MQLERRQEEAEQVVPVDGIIGQSEALQRVLRQVELVAATEANVLIQGESGTGKELIARAIHVRSPRAHRSLVKVNCASIPKDLFESEFFGHVRGAFTGAVSDRVGRFQLADRGTLVLDEVIGRVGDQAEGPSAPRGVAGTAARRHSQHQDQQRQSRAQDSLFDAHVRISPFVY